MRKAKTLSISILLILSCALCGCFKKEERKPTQEISQLITTADQLEKEKEYLKAVAIWEQIATKEPNNAFYLYRLGRVYSKIGQDEKAISILNESLEINFENSDALVILGYAYLRTGQLEKAKVSFEKALELSPDYDDAKVGLAAVDKKQKDQERKISEKSITETIDKALKANKEGESAKAIALWNDVLKERPDDEQALFHLGLAYRNLEDLDQAISYFKRVLAINPNNSDALFLLGLVQRQAGEREKAVATFQKLKKLDPNYPEVDHALEKTIADHSLQDEKKKASSDLALRIEKAEQLEKDKQLEKAFAIWEELHKEDSENAYFLFKLGQLSYRQRKFEEAAFYLETSIKLSEEDADAYYFLGLAYAQQKKYPEARAQFEKALALVPDYKDVSDALKRYRLARKKETWEEGKIKFAECLEKRRDYKEALCAWKQLYEAHPEDPYYSFRLGYLLARMNRFSQSEMFLNKALAIDPEDQEALLHMGYLQLARGRNRSAESWFLHLLSLSPGRSGALDGLARAQFAQDRFCEAADTLSVRVTKGPLDYAMWKLDYRNLGETRFWVRDQVVYVQERETDIITKLTSAQRYTFVNVLSWSLPTQNERFNITGTYLAGTEREVNLIGRTNNLFVKFGIAGIGAVFRPKPDWKLAGSFNVKWGQNVGESNFNLGSRKRIEPAGSINYSQVDRSYGLSATVDSLLIKLFGTPRATFVLRDTYLGFAQRQFFNRRITAQLTGFYRYYHDGVDNRQWDSELWVEHGFPRFSPLVFVRYIGRIGGFKTNKANYYSYKRQWEHFAAIYFSRYTAYNVEMELWYQHSWQQNRKLSQPVNTAVLINKLFRSTDKIYFELRQLYRPNIRGVFHAEYYWDSTRYTAWAVKGNLTCIF